jgi:hypothetical protein
MKTKFSPFSTAYRSWNELNQLVHKQQKKKKSVAIRGCTEEIVEIGVTGQKLRPLGAMRQSTVCKDVKSWSREMYRYWAVASQRLMKREQTEDIGHIIMNSIMCELWIVLSLILVTSFKTQDIEFPVQPSCLVTQHLLHLLSESIMIREGFKLKLRAERYPVQYRSDMD